MAMPTIQQAIEIAIVIATFTTTAMSIYHLANVVQHIKPGKAKLASLFAPFSLLSPSIYDSRGNYHRVRFGWYFLGALGSFLVLMLLGT